MEKMCLRLEAQSVENSPFKQKAQGSGPSRAAYFLPFSSQILHCVFYPCKMDHCFIILLSLLPFFKHSIYLCSMPSNVDMTSSIFYFFQMLCIHYLWKVSHKWLFMYMYLCILLFALYSSLVQVKLVNYPSYLN